MSRLAALDGAEVDAVVIGGGIAGAGVARDLALRGASVALFERGDFACGTSSRSSKLIHGGLRYLELFDFRLVRESLRERETLRRLAPHQVQPLPFLVPIYGDSTRSLVMVRIGLRLYHWLSPGRRRRERYRVLPPVDALSLEPSIRADDLRGAGYYFDDLLVSPERLCLENVLSALRHGARAFNYCEVEEIAGQTVRVRDLLSDRVHAVRARVIVNAAGPWVDRIRELASITDRGRHIVRTTKGIHCLLPRMTSRAVYHSTRDDRMIFVIPWREFSLVGTTDTDFDGDLDRLYATRDEVEYLLGEVRRVLPDPRVTPGQVAYTYAGVRPLSHEEGKRASEVSREHKVVAEGPGGRFLSITGTKLTCFRSLAEEVGDAVLRVLGRQAPSRTAALSLDGAEESIASRRTAVGWAPRVRGEPEDAGRVEARAWLDVSSEAATSALSKETIETLVTTYGRAYPRLVDLAGKVPDGAERLCPSNPEIVAQLHQAVHDEMTVSLQDLLLRRTGIGSSACQGRDCAESIGARMAELCGWTPRRLAAELQAYEAHVARSQRFRA